ncbi:E3 ubiquitin-protein ligase MARCH3 [Trachymyrmex septentrionalis]|uniref:E3 ubiquitin-protein ligase MARCH3 n=1 Tax=Trachymyrmex septentrionalis TaxID=34720 RepID=A0A195EWR5_9HYME|nr:PREDICTED: E3 ubiquitin-protein ligase MARCH3-like isoform X2 [Trachymyrmex septentrionalis]KYN32668.1 E3 ubiquitin-protein ligase MARCH3 [Trachymyrmex septentrionalis]
MSHVESAEPKNDSGRTNEIVANERDKSVVQASPESSVNVEIRISASKTSQILDNIKSDLETEENDEKRVDTSQDKDNTCIASGDICRICHMGGYAPIADNHLSCDSENLIDQTPILSNLVDLGPLISACKCRGTVALVHIECLERWLTESGRARCELCGYKYAIRRVRRYSFFQSVVIWFRTIIATRQMLLDIGYLIMTTPVAVFSCYLCALALKMLMRNGFYEIPWMIIAMLPTCLLTLIAYWRWIITLGRLHGHRWRRYWRNNFVVRLIPDNDIENSLDPQSSNDRFDVRDDFEQWRLEEYNEFA